MKEKKPPRCPGYEYMMGRCRNRSATMDGIWCASCNERRIANLQAGMAEILARANRRAAQEGKE